MSITSIGNNPAISNIQFSSIAPVASQGSDSDGDNDGSGVAKAGGAGGRFASAINQALAQLGVTPGSSSSATSASSASDPNGFYTGPSAGPGVIHAESVCIAATSEWQSGDGFRERRRQ